jgi:hypothetical protein
VFYLVFWFCDLDGNCVIDSVFLRIDDTSIRYTIGEGVIVNEYVAIPLEKNDKGSGMGSGMGFIPGSGTSRRNAGTNLSTSTN